MTYSKEEIISMGTTLINKYDEYISEGVGGVEMKEWYMSCQNSCRELLHELENESLNDYRIRELTRVMQEEYGYAKPPVISYWCRRVNEYMGFN